MLLALLKNIRPHAWEGANRIDLVREYAPWILEDGERCQTVPPVDAVLCAIGVAGPGKAMLHPVSEDFPVDKCNHWVGACESKTPIGATVADSSLQAYYNQFGVIVLGTVIDGHCGPDVGCKMLGWPQTSLNRSRLREEASDYLCERAREPWLQQFLVSTQEISKGLFDKAQAESMSVMVHGPPISLGDDDAPAPASWCHCSGGDT